MPELSDVDKEMLELADTWFKYAGAKEAAMRDRFDVSPVRFWQIVNDRIDWPEALAWNPQRVRRLQRLRNGRRRQRSARARGIDLT